MALQEGKVCIEGSVCFLNYDLSFGVTEKVIDSLENYFYAQSRKVIILPISNKMILGVFKSLSKN